MIASTLPLPQKDHPLASFSTGDQADDPAELAAALGRPELALQLEIDRNGSGERARHLLEISAAAIRLRPSTDLAQILRSRPIFEYGRTALPTPILAEEPTKPVDQSGKNKPLTAAVTPAAQRSSSGRKSEPSIYLDGRVLRLVDYRLRTSVDLLENGGNLLILDVPLCGNSLLHAKVSAQKGAVTGLGLRAFDQRNGQVIGTVFSQGDRKTTVEGRLSLGGIYGWAAVQIELRGPAGTEFLVQTLRID